MGKKYSPSSLRESTFAATQLFLTVLLEFQILHGLPLDSPTGTGRLIPASIGRPDPMNVVITISAIYWWDNPTTDRRRYPKSIVLGKNRHSIKPNDSLAINESRWRWKAKGREYGCGQKRLTRSKP